jgi:hypothetical protein
MIIMVSNQRLLFTRLRYPRLSPHWLETSLVLPQIQHKLSSRITISLPVKIGHSDLPIHRAFGDSHQKMLDLVALSPNCSADPPDSVIDMRQVR